MRTLLQVHVCMCSFCRVITCLSGPSVTISIHNCFCLRFIKYLKHRLVCICIFSIIDIEMSTTLLSVYFTLFSTAIFMQNIAPKVCLVYVHDRGTRKLVSCTSACPCQSQKPCSQIEEGKYFHTQSVTLLLPPT